MKTIKKLLDPNGGVTVPCPDGKQVRVCSYMAGISTAVQGENFTIDFLRSNDLLFSLCTPPVAVAAAVVSAVVGGSPSGGTLVGAALVGDRVSLALPDLWFEFEIIVRGIGSDGITTGATVVCYEERDTE